MRAAAIHTTIAALFWPRRQRLNYVTDFVAGTLSFSGTPCRFISWAQGAPIVRIVAFVAALAVWLIGWFCRVLLP